MRILVTGGAGFVGSNLAVRLKDARKEAQVIALDNLHRRGSELAVARLRAAGIEFRHGDVRSTEDLDGIGAVDLILDCAAEPSVLAGVGESPRYVLDTNLVGTLNILEVARRHDAGLIFLSTSRVYPVDTLNAVEWTERKSRYDWLDEQSIPGVGSEGVREDFPLAGPRTMYGATKLASELILSEYVAGYGLKAVVNRCGVIAGPWQMGKVDQGVVVHWIAQHFFGGSLKYLGFEGSGRQVRDVLHVDDLYRLVDIQITDLDRHAGEVYNVGGGRDISFSLTELTDMCREATGRSIPVDPAGEERPGDLRIYLTDNSRVRSATGWQPEIGTAEIVRQIAQWIEANQTMLRPIFFDSQ